MKLATLKDGSRDGLLAVVSRDMTVAHFASGIATTLQQVLDDWNFRSPPLEDLYATLNGGKARHAFAFDPRQCMAPLPRAHQWLEGGAYLAPAEPPLPAGVGEAAAEVPEGPPMTQGASDDFSGPADDARFVSAEDGIDFAGGLAVVTGDVDIGTTASAALDSVRLLMLVNAWTLRHRVPGERARGGGLLHSKPAAAFGPVAVTPEELGPAWRRGRVHLALESRWNGHPFGLCEAGADMRFGFGRLVAHAAQTRRLRAGCIVGSGVVSQAGAAQGYACVAARRALETAATGAPVTAYLQFGDTVGLDLRGADGHSVFGAIAQRVAPLHAPEAVVPLPAPAEAVPAAPVG